MFVVSHIHLEFFLNYYLFIFSVRASEEVHMIDLADEEAQEVPPMHLGF